LRLKIQQGLVLIKKLFKLCILLLLLAVAFMFFWARQPIIAAGQPLVEFTIPSGSSFRASMMAIKRAGAPVNPMLMTILAQLNGSSTRLKAGTYDIRPGTTPPQLLEQLVKGETSKEALRIIEGWTFKQMRAAIDGNPYLRHDTVGWSSQQLMQKIAAEDVVPEGLFYPDTYLFAKNSSDVEIYRQSYQLMKKYLDDAWAKRAPGLPYASPYEALVMASIVEKETGQKSERTMIAGVFVNRLKKHMLLQTDPTVIYGMGDRYKGNISKRDLLTDTPHNTYTRVGLPPTPISLPGLASIQAALHPAATSALYFVSRGDGTSVFSDNLVDHINAVRKYQLKR
jgi:UPF0755 protein